MAKILWLGLAIISVTALTFLSWAPSLAWDLIVEGQDGERSFIMAALSVVYHLASRFCITALEGAWFVSWQFLCQRTGTRLDLWRDARK